MLVLVCNVGSTSLKYKLFNMPDTRILVEARMERVGNPDYSLFSYDNPQTGYREKGTRILLPSYTEGINLFLSYLTDAEKGCLADMRDIKAVGFKTVVAKGFLGVHEVTEEVLEAMEAYAGVAPAHNPPYIEAIRKFKSILPETPMVGVFETAFHTTIPLERRMYALPYEWYETYGIQRFGYHGASHGYIARQVASRIGNTYRLVSCHLGGSGSLCAIRDGKSVDTSFGFSLQTGIPHANRSGDMDAYIIPYLLNQGLGMDEILRGIDKSGGLLGVSGVSNDMRDIEEAAAQGNERAALAIEMFCDSVAKYIGAFTVSLGGLDYLVFTGGIGENSSCARNGICKRLSCLGVTVDTAGSTTAADGILSSPSSKVTVAVIPTNEEVGIAQEIFASLSPAHAPAGNA